ncbi:hypothetical protein QRX50_29040 [Amycolatopsis carbonis]|uniref:Uncharacterized protein n=1 Tax=Amycolatopsis carbonis TaxID=715471 RepID=A0A9Y2MS48_9PSEU|nr:hypothetical protein [Amycolatopsis sp. 2-15]WIX75548.1 hypothetical protein QRX50_29040 [Amycolatopsis sp. 2-15]
MTAALRNLKGKLLPRSFTTRAFVVRAAAERISSYFVRVFA